MPEPTKPIDTAMASRWDAYIAWLALSESDRLVRGLPKTKSAYAESVGVSVRMLSKYEHDERFQARQRNSGQLPALPRVHPSDAAPKAPSRRPVPAPEMPDDPETGEPEESSDEDDYRAAKAALVRNARTGDKASLDLYLKYYGKPFIEDEAAARNADLVNLDTPSLVARAVLWLAPAELAAELRAAGWTVETPAGPLEGLDV